MPCNPLPSRHPHPAATRGVALAAAVAVTLAIGACDRANSPMPTAPAARPQISDGAHGGNAHFYWLPPLVANPTTTGTFDGTLSPTVEICLLTSNPVTTPTASCGSSLVTFTTVGGGKDASEIVRASLADELYIVNWHTDLYGLQDDSYYRIVVRVNGVVVGTADVDPVSSAKAMKNVDNGEFIPLLDGRTLPIKFRLEAGVAAPPALHSLTSGHRHACALNAAGAAYCWGINDLGQLGIGSTGGQRTTPTAVVGGHTFASLVAGGYHTCGLTSSGDAYCWGLDEEGQLGTGAAGPPAAAPVAVTGGLHFASLAGGSFFTCGLAYDGGAFCWGYNFSGQLGVGDFADRAQPTLVGGNLTFRELRARDHHACGIVMTGETYCWGWNGFGQLGVGDIDNRTLPTLVLGSHQFARVAPGGEHSCALDLSGYAWCWGLNEAGQLGSGSTSPISVVQTTPQLVMGTSASSPPLAFQSLEAGAMHSCGIATSGGTFCWGQNFYGEIGDGATADRPYPTPVLGGGVFGSLSYGLGLPFTCALTGAGAVYCWGDNGFGQLGNGTTTPSLTPVPISTAGIAP